MVRVYENDSGSWNQVGSDVYGSTDSRLGFSLGLSDDGNAWIDKHSGYKIKDIEYLYRKIIFQKVEPNELYQFFYETDFFKR